MPDPPVDPEATVLNLVSEVEILEKPEGRKRKLCLRASFLWTK